jgi:hypothetical protein
MKTVLFLMLMALLTLGPVALAERVHQSLPGEKASAGDGSSALDKKLIEVKADKGATSGKVARVVGSVGQWGFVTYWFGVPAPEGKSILRLRVLVEDGAGEFAVYIRPAGGGQQMIGKIAPPADARPGSFVDIDLAIDAKGEWSGAVIKKMAKDDKPGPWIDTISVVTP